MTTATVKSAALAAAAISLGAVNAHAATLRATPANLNAQVAAARPGDVVQLQGGAYPPMNLWNIKKAAPGVTIMPAPGGRVTAPSIDASDSTHLIFDGIEIAMTGGNGVQAGGNGGQGMVFRHMKVHQADNKTLAGGGFWIRNGGGVTLDQNEVSWVGNGITILDSANAVVTGNVLHDIGTDQIVLAGAQNAVVRGNTGTNSHPPDGAHPDFIQWFGGQVNHNPCGMDIEDNRFDRGTGGISQGVFGEDGCNVTIKGNIMRGTMYNGIALARTKGAVISGNFVAGYPDMESRIFVRGGCDDVHITGNAAQAIFNYKTAGEPACTNVTVANNKTLKPAPLGDDKPLNAWLAVKP